MRALALAASAGRGFVPSVVCPWPVVVGKSGDVSNRRPDGEPVGTISDRLLAELREELLAKTGRQWAHVSSGSMGPMIRAGDRVLVEQVDPASVRFGDVILFRSSGAWVVHRVIGRYRRAGELTFVEKGDLSDGWGIITGEYVLGRVSVVDRRGRRLGLLSGRDRVLQLALAGHSIVSWFLRRTMFRVLSRRRTGFVRRFSSWLDGMMLALPDRLVAALNGGPSDINRNVGFGSETSVRAEDPHR